jgi:hypothetical protein
LTFYFNRICMKKFHLISNDDDYYDDKKGFIKLENCQYGGQKCIDQLAAINECKLNAQRYILNKEYESAIDELNTAYSFTFGLASPTCQQCAGFFQSIIIKSLEQIKSDLQKMTSGIFRRKCYLPDLLLVNKVLEELKKNGDNPA